MGANAFAGAFAEPPAPHLDEVREFLADAAAPEFNPLSALLRVLRGRWLQLMGATAMSAAALGAIGFVSGAEVYEGQAIIRISAKEPSILYADGDDSRLKLFQAFVKGETTYVASRPVMERAAAIIAAAPQEGAPTPSAEDLTRSVSIQRSEALIVVTAASGEAEFAAARANAVVDAYLSLHAETEARRASYRERELAAREQDLLGKLEGLNGRMLSVGGEYGMSSLTKAHIEKVAQLDAQISRQAEVAATLAAMEAKTSLAGADMGDVEIKRATLLDRGLADLTFDKTKREAELVTLLRRYAEDSPQVLQKQLEIEVVDRAIAERREQIAVLGRTGALTDASETSEETSKAEIKALKDKLGEQIETLRSDARALNGKRIELEFLEEERSETRRMLDETRRALDVIRVESRNAMPGMIEVMSRAVAPDRAAKDKRKMLGALGVVGGGGVAAMLFLGLAVTRGRVRYSDDLWRVAARSPVLRVVGRRRGHAGALDAADVDRLVTGIQLLPSRGAPSADAGRTIVVGAADAADSAAVAEALACSFARCGLPTTLVDADASRSDLTRAHGAESHSGWRQLLLGRSAEEATAEGLRFIGAGSRDRPESGLASVRSVRAALNAVREGDGVVVVHVGRLDEVWSDPIASASDLVLAVAQPGDALKRVEQRVDRMAGLARSGAAVAFIEARKGDPGLHC